MNHLSELIEPLVRTGAGAGRLPTRPSSTNPRIIVTEHFANFAGGNLVSLGVAKHPPGEGCEPHTHRGAVELFYVLSGFGVVEIDGIERHIQKGDSVVVPCGAVHRLAALPLYSDEALLTSHDPFEVLCALVVAPGHGGDKAPWSAVDA